ncbi:MAG: hypothetical protein HOA40_09205 [Porticoccaceae bacterium]|jgi:hypothetical protein|nr:hypothetical protein [Porticoccaceae bacterium]MBT6422554.1 hypothetical protein [Porticoccaceae bacterium]MBT6692240.1 hypothetical protein [Porticoccaceae bacterium]MBT6799731.1 hypothetical protein [Porticoccaceae bacterium]
MKNLCLLLGLFLVAAGIAVPALGHHSVTMFDLKNTITLTGTVKKFRWSNPHVILWVDVDPPEGGESQRWAFELTSPGNLSRSGWSKRSFSPGDRVSIDNSPLKNGKTGGLLKRAVILKTGEVLLFKWRKEQVTKP